MTASPQLSIVTPVFNEAEHILDSLTVIIDTAREMDAPFEIVVIDDGSTDDTWSIVQAIADRVPELKCASLARNFGKEGAIRAGLEIAAGDAVVLMDCDLQHPPALIPEMYRLWREDGFKVVNGVKRDRRNEPAIVALRAKVFYGILQRLAGTRLLGSSDFKLLDREIVDLYRRLPERNMFFRGLVSWLGYAQADIPFEVPPRASGTSKWSTLKLFGLALNAVVSFSSAPLHFVTWSGVVFLGFAVLLAGQTMYRWFAGQAIEGFTTVILLILIVSSILMLSLGIVGQYLAKIFDEIKGRPRFLIKDAVRVDQGLVSGIEVGGPSSVRAPEHARSGDEVFREVRRRLS